MKAPRAVRKWTKEEDEKLKAAVEKVGTKNWVEVAKCRSERRG